MNPLLGLRKNTNASSTQLNSNVNESKSTTPISSPSVESKPRLFSQHSLNSNNNNKDGSELPPLVVLKEVCFYLQLVPTRSSTSSIPIHLLGELAKTSSGMKEIMEQNLLKYFLSKIKNPQETNCEKRAALWGIGHLGATEIGFERLITTEGNLMKMISQVATESSCLSLRGTASYTLGLFSRHRLGCEALHKIGWATLDARSHPFATIAVPNSVKVSPFHLPGGRFTSLDVTTCLSCSIDEAQEEGMMSKNSSKPIALSSPEASRVLSLISDLSNHIAQKDAHAELTKIKENNPQIFTDLKLYLAVHDLLARFSYELAVRQYILGLFHTKISFESELTWQQIDAEPLH